MSIRLIADFVNPKKMERMHLEWDFPVMEMPINAELKESVFLKAEQELKRRAPDWKGDAIIRLTHSEDCKYHQAVWLTEVSLKFRCYWESDGWSIVNERNKHVRWKDFQLRM